MKRALARLAWCTPVIPIVLAILSLKSYAPVISLLSRGVADDTGISARLALAMAVEAGKYLVVLVTTMWMALQVTQRIS
ncbi:MAG: hypothetical protein JXM73_24300 [Anaerolineae bacterium]|nr:hypothetical protein [Anaerolineae bacterium]